MNLLKKSLLESPIVKKKGYDYVIAPITDGIPEIEPELLREVINEMKKWVNKDIDKIVTIEAMGIPLAAGLSLEIGIPFTIIRKREYGLPNEISVQQVTGYSKSKLYINGIKKGEKVVLVDDVLSTGGTLKAVLSAFQKMGVILKGVFIAIDKGDCARSISREFNINIKTLVNLEVKNGRVIVKERKEGE
jgi:adenine phosphoribosyltransferase